MNTEQHTQYPHTIYATPDGWGRDTYYEGYESMQRTIDSLKYAGGEEWNDISINDCDEYDFYGTHGPLGIYYHRNSGTEYVAFRFSGDDTFARATSCDIYDNPRPELAEIVEELDLAEYITYEDANARVESTPELAAHADTILYDWPEGAEHWEWVCTAPVADIVDWAACVERAA